MRWPTAGASLIRSRHRPGSSGLGRRSTRFLVKSEWRSTVIFSISWRARTQVSSVDLMAPSSAAASASEAGALGRDRRRLRGRILGGRGPELLDLRSDGGELRAQRLGGVGGVGQDALHVDAQPAQLLFELGQVLYRLLGGLDGRRQPRNAVGNVGTGSVALSGAGWEEGVRQAAGAAGCGGAGCGACAAAGAASAIASSAAARQQCRRRKYRCFIR